MGQLDSSSPYNHEHSHHHHEEHNDNLLRGSFPPQAAGESLFPLLLRQNLTKLHPGPDHDADEDDEEDDDEDDDHKFNATHLSDSLPDVWVNHYFFEDF